MAASFCPSLSLQSTNWRRHSVIMAEDDQKPAVDVPQVSISNNEASNPPSQQSQGNDVVMADVPTDQAVRPLL